MAESLCTYRRRRANCIAPAFDDDDKENDKELHAPLVTLENRIATSSRANKNQPSWIDRSLSSRRNVNKVKPDSFSSRRANDKAKQVMSPNVYRKKRVEAPENFVREQRSYFEEVDAFELEEESPPSKDRWLANLQQEDTGIPYVPFHRKGLLQAVQEDTLEDLPNDVSMCNLSSHKDPLSHILMTPRSLEGTQKSVPKGQLQISKQGYRENTGVSIKAHETPLTQKLLVHVYEDPLRHTLKTPQSLDTVQTAEFKKQAQISKQKVVEKTASKTRASHKAHEKPLTRKLTLDALTGNQSVSEVLAQRSILGVVQVELDKKPVYKGLATPTERIPTIIISDDENEHPRELFKLKTFSSSKQLRQQAQDSEAARARQYIVLDDSPASLNNECKTLPFVAPVKCESQRISSTNKVDPENKNVADMSVKRLAVGTEAGPKTGVQAVQLLCKTDEALVEEVEKLKFQANKESPNLDALLEACGQKTPMELEEAIGQISNVKNIVKLGEGTYGEAFRASNLVFKIVPMGGNFRVNGEVQKTFSEMYTEMLLTLTLNRLRKESSIELEFQRNVCNNFIETKMVKVCQGLYGHALMEAWEIWNLRHESENDHPKVFPENQVYMLFVLADGGKDLESFPVASFDVARSILTQVTAALAIAEEDCEFEHRDLHWGNILVAQTEISELHCRLDGTDLQISTYGVFVHIIDFTLSRLSTGEEVLFSNLSDDPLLFKGPKGDVQAETYRKMLHLTKGSWDKRFPKTNCYWIHYLIDILLTNKKYLCSAQECRALRLLRKRVLNFESARACLQDEFFVCKKKGKG
ncbi:hypothetical protein GOP47_0015211 [Adiantum capillus-veneris]|uniref:non-specific serine/threonine protein kinase n=1 Tax=Adiantum capillus-veneris TaxID=13818 RepID=A0A9D4ZCV6_ADICA|nr:hypothetical protein GOP47_0015211 [Adiantum capillus-veneris]